ncbi:MAG: glycosyltransferase family 2 protein [Candidatus Omnitrophota bacterium]
MKLSIVVPVFNEEKTIEKIIKRVQAVDIEKEIVVVDDGSTDNTKQILQGLASDSIKVLYHSRNLGKGSALKTGFNNITGDIVIIQDADLEYDPNEYSNLIAPIIAGAADVVYGSRLSGGRPQRVYMFWHKVGNNILSLLTNIIYNTTLTDMETGYKVFKREVIKDIDIRSKDFTVEAELTAKIFKKHKIRVYEIPISYYGRDYSEGKKIKWYHAISALWALIKYRFVD